MSTSKALLALSLALAGCQNAYADTTRDPRPGYPPDAGSAPREADTSAPRAQPAPEASGTPKPWAPAFDVAFEEGPSPAPSRQEWAAAPIATEARVTDPGCKVQRVREWYRIGCQATHWIELVSGERKGLSFGCRRETKDSVACDETWVVLQARRGDRRALELFTWSKWGPTPDVILTEQFLEGDPSPVVAVHGLHWGF